MELVLVHITDIHLENDTDYNILEGRSEYIANAINKHIIDETNTLLILCITGDIAYSGKEEQYLFASIFISDIIAGIKKRYNDLFIQIVTVPGNHDCDFDREDSVIRESVLRDSNLDMLNGSIIKTCTTAEENYFNFVKDWDESIAPLVSASAESIFAINGLRYKGVSLKFHCLNTAWCSSKNEKPKEMRIAIPEQEDNHAGHGAVNGVDSALKNSCNDYLCEVSYRLGMIDNDEFSDKQALNYIQEYAKMFDLDEKSGIELTESKPKITDNYAIPSAIGQKINATYDKIAIWGNRDCGGGAARQYENIMQQSGFTVLKNENWYVTTDSDKKILFTGLDDSMLGNVYMPDSTKIYDSNYNILLIHEPDTADSFQEYPYDLVLSGHSHGGQVNIPFIPAINQKAISSTNLAKNYVSGMYELNSKTKIYVNTGIGTTHVSGRLGVVPEISIFHIYL